MSELFNFTLSDMLMFSTDTYVRMFELYNADIWPLHIVALLIGSGLLAAHWWRNEVSSRLLRTAYISLGLSWLWIAYAFHAQRYATINLGGKGFAILFALEGLLILALAWAANSGRLLDKNKLQSPAPIAHALLLIGIVAWPIASVFATGEWRSVQLFALTPDATAIGSLGLFLLAPSPNKYLLCVIPIIWCVISAATHWALLTA